MPPPTTTKPCIYCGKDCSAIPRLKDDRGRYACRACAENARALRSSPPLADDVFGLEDPIDPRAASPANANPTRPRATPAPIITTAPCPRCSRPLRSDAALCTSCGYSASSKCTLSTSIGRPITENLAPARKTGFSESRWAPFLIGVALTALLPFALALLIQVPAPLAYAKAALLGLGLTYGLLWIFIIGQTLEQNDNDYILVRYVPGYILLWIVFRCDNIMLKGMCIGFILSGIITALLQSPRP